MYQLLVILHQYLSTIRIDDSIDQQPIILPSTNNNSTDDIIQILYFWKYFPYHRLVYLQSSSVSVLQPKDTTTTTTSIILNRIVYYLLRPEIVLLLLVCYLFSKSPLRCIRNHILQWEHTNTIPKWFQYSIIIHNALLAIFSCLTAYYTIYILYIHITHYGWYTHTYCDNYGILWNASNFGTWAIIFYISKYYEFIDTFILVLKGKDASVLQMYHHTGIVYIMYCAILSHASWLLFVVLFNSIIHTIMYTYFCMKSLYPHIQFLNAIAQYITIAQITQFMIGILCTLPIFWLGSTCHSRTSQLALALLHIYGIGLILLFVLFAQNKYRTSKTSTTSKKSKST